MSAACSSEVVFMRVLRLALVLATAVGVAGCGSEQDAVMPDVKGKQLDVAKSAITDAGVSDEVKVDGGGTFGVIKESNWEVCAQSPAAGIVVGEAPRLTVDRSCDDVAVATKPAEPDERRTAADTTQPPAAEPSDADAALSRKGNAELSALLKVSELRTATRRRATTSSSRPATRAQSQQPDPTSRSKT
jgi:beta-lactam-binding protein with PASTA domain